MKPSEPENKVCDLKYLHEMMGGKKLLIKEILDAFLEQIPGELKSINDAIGSVDYPIIKSIAHTMRSSVSIMGVAALTPILQEMEDLGGASKDIERINQLNERLIVICKQAVQEIEKEQIHYAA